MNYRIENKEAFTYEDAKVQVPKFWQEHFASGKGKVVMGIYGVNLVEQFDSKTFEYFLDVCYNKSYIRGGKYAKSNSSKHRFAKSRKN